MPSLPDDVRSSLIGKLATANAATAAHYPTTGGARQPVHTVYGGAQLFKAGLAGKLGMVAGRMLDQYAGGAEGFAETIGLEARGDVAETIFARVKSKLAREAVEDFRIDFEDGYGNRSDAEEDEHARTSARETATGIAENSLPPFIGIRIKPLSDEMCRRSLATLDLYLSDLCAASKGTLPGNFVVTLPKITSPDQVTVLAEALSTIENRLALPDKSVAIELMIETTQSIVGPDGRWAIPSLVAAADGRCVAAHFGTYDYTAVCGITAAHQTSTHSACDFARHVMQVCLAETNTFLSDGATTVLPVPAHKQAKNGPALSESQVAENRTTVHDAWRMHADNVRHSLAHGYYQGWDLHPGQLPVRYAVYYDFFLSSLESSHVRLKNFVDKAAQATLSGDVFDDAATGQGLLNFFLRGISCGALTEDEALAAGVTLDELRGRSFLKILENRKNR